MLTSIYPCLGSVAIQSSHGGLPPSLRKRNAMAFADPQSITVNAVAQSMPRTGSGDLSGSFQTADGAFKLDISHQHGKRNRHVLRVTQTKTVADTLVPATNIIASMSTYVVVDAPTFGFTNAELKNVVDALSAYLAASSGAKVTQLLGNEA